MYEPLEEDDVFDRSYVVHGGEYADDEVHVNTCESHASLTRGELSSLEGSRKTS
ncbi:ISH4 transposase [Natronococcus jeotgali DSM 18795]|uniref:ISH4 transposase n=1 Tax=Natronococcus jeotgali DSM 18795 TaxID=1227498 RepID=L9X432_9EURY|nr:ISH4 transposase [Natronococcus jeotgali DSM 18795]